MTEILRYVINDNIVNQAMNDFNSDMELLKNRSGINNVISFLNQSDYFVAPASSKYHLPCIYGLLVHSWSVRNNAIKLSEVYNFNKESAILCSWFHDVCKIGIYEKYNRNVKIFIDEKHFKWVQITDFKFTEDEDFPMGHGSKSVLMLLKLGLQMTDDEVAAILNHMGAFNTFDYSSTTSLLKAFEKYPLSLIIHTADLISSKMHELDYIKKLSDKEIFDIVNQGG